MLIEEVARDIFVIQDFFSHEEMSSIELFLKTAEFKRTQGTKNSFADGLPDSVGAALNTGMVRLKTIIETKYGCTVAQENQGTIVKYDIGWILHPHLDTYEKLPTYGGYPTRDISSLFYLSGGFVGGELHFINPDVTIIPQANMAVFFPSGEGFMHEVTELLEGDRYTCTSFWHVLEGRFCSRR